MSISETEALLAESASSQYGPGDDNKMSSSSHKKHIGVVSAMFIIFNRLIGTGIFATPAVILAFSGSVGMSLSLWVVGTLFAVAGMEVYIIWGTAFPRNGGEKNYLEYLFPYPQRLVTCMFAANVSLSAWSAGNSLVFGEYLSKAILNREPSSTVLEMTALACITSSLLLHGITFKWGLRIQNALGVIKLFIIFVIIATGYVAFRDGIPMRTESEGRWRGHENFRDVWKGTSGSLVALCTALYSVIWSFAGFSNANYALSEVRDPARTLRIAGPFALVVVEILYILSNLAYFAGASKDEIVGSGRLVVSLLMRNIWGENVERWVDFGVALSALGNVLAVSFSQGRVNQELGKEGVLPFSSFWASNSPFNAPLTGLGLHWFVCVLVIFFVPSGDAYNFVVNVITYPLSVINATISFGLIYLHYLSRFHSHSSIHQHLGHHQWQHLSTHTLLSALFFGLSSLFLVIIPVMKPPPGAEPYESLPYWTHAAGGWGVFGVGAIWWCMKRRKKV